MRREQVIAFLELTRELAPGGGASPQPIAVASGEPASEATGRPIWEVVEDFQEEHPDELREPLGVAIDAGVLAHDVLDGFDGGGDGHFGFGGGLGLRVEG